MPAREFRSGCVRATRRTCAHAPTCGAAMKKRQDRVARASAAASPSAATATALPKAPHETATRSRVGTALRQPGRDRAARDGGRHGEDGGDSSEAGANDAV